MTSEPAAAQHLRELSVTEVCFEVGSSLGTVSTRFTELAPS